MDLGEIIHKIGYWLFVLFLVYIIFELILKILGGSLGFEALITTLLVANIAHSFNLMAQISRLNAKLSEHIGWHKGSKK